MQETILSPSYGRIYKNFYFQQSCPSKASSQTSYSAHPVKQVLPLPSILIPADYALLAEKSLTILGNLAFISSKFGYSAFDEWNFIYLSNIDILSRYPLKASHFISQNPPHKLPEHPTQRADSLFYLDTLEQFIPVLPTQEIQKVLGTVYLSLDCVSEISLRAHLEAAHSVFLAILGRGDILHDQIISYLDRVYTVLPLPSPLSQWTDGRHSRQH